MVAGFRQLTRVGAAVVVVVALVAAVEQLPSSTRNADARISEDAGLSSIDRELAPSRAFGLDPSLVLLADERLPPDAVFYVAVGNGLASGHDAAAPFSAYWLLPRRHTEDPARADWILSFGADDAQFGVQTEVVEDLGNGLRLLRVVR